MKESLLNEELFRHAFIVSLVIGILCRGLILRVTDKQYPTRPQDYLEQIIISGLSAALGAIALPALIDKEFSSLTFFAVAIQQFQGLSKQERITIENIDNMEVVPKGKSYIEEIASTYESRSYISLFSSLISSIIYIVFARRYKLGMIQCTILALMGAIIVAMIFKRFLKRYSIGDFADVKIAKINFDGPLLKVNEVVISNIGLEETRKKYMEKGLAIEIVPKSIGDFGIINDEGQKQAILHNIFIHMGIDKDIDDKDILAISRTDLDNKSIVISYIPIIKDIDILINAVKSTPVLGTSKAKQSAYKIKMQ